MTNSPRISLRIPPEIQSALDKYCQEHNLVPSTFILQAIIEKLNQPDLAKAIRQPHRPKSD